MNLVLRILFLSVISLATIFFPNFFLLHSIVLDPFLCAYPHIFLCTILVSVLWWKQKCQYFLLPNSWFLIRIGHVIPFLFLCSTLFLSILLLFQTLWRHFYLPILFLFNSALYRFSVPLSQYSQCLLYLVILYILPCLCKVCRY